MTTKLQEKITFSSIGGAELSREYINKHTPKNIAHVLYSNWNELNIKNAKISNGQLL
ncbi:MAG UNVERIFIED_CONTAM: hypothetical protein LVQ98_03515 [Rickettsiaceae bacterium]|jgi:hypothetical protein